MKLVLRNGWVMGVQDNGCYWYGKTSDNKAFTVAEYFDGVAVSPEGTGQITWICETVEMAHKSLADNGLESPWEVVE